MSLKFKCLLKRNIKGPLKKLLWNLSLSLFFSPTWRPQLILPCTLFFETDRWKVNLAVLRAEAPGMGITCVKYCATLPGSPAHTGLEQAFGRLPAGLLQFLGAPVPGPARLWSNSVKYRVGLVLGHHFYFHLWQSASPANIWAKQFRTDRRRSQMCFPFGWEAHLFTTSQVIKTTSSKWTNIYSKGE